MQTREARSTFSTRPPKSQPRIIVLYSTIITHTVLDLGHLSRLLQSCCQHPSQLHNIRNQQGSCSVVVFQTTGVPKYLGTCIGRQQTYSTVHTHCLINTTPAWILCIDKCFVNRAADRRRDRLCINLREPALQIGPGDGGRLCRMGSANWIPLLI